MGQRQNSLLHTPQQKPYYWHGTRVQFVLEHLPVQHWHTHYFLWQYSQAGCDCSSHVVTPVAPQHVALHLLLWAAVQWQQTQNMRLCCNLLDVPPLMAALYAAYVVLKEGSTKRF